MHMIHSACFFCMAGRGSLKQKNRRQTVPQRAANETRTRDPDLGKVVLYQLSYCRKRKKALLSYSRLGVKRMRLELTRHNCHYPLKVARLPIPPSLHFFSFRCICNCRSAQNRTRTCTSVQHSHLKRARLPFRHLGIPA